jgi:CheY-like chemotaxis protein
MAPLHQSILCVLGDEGERALVAELLQPLEVVFACDVQEALREIATRAFDAYLLDYWLPDDSGPRLCREVRKSDPAVPILFCMAPSQQTDRRRALRAGASALVYKPIDPTRMQPQVRVLLEIAALQCERSKVWAERAAHEELQKRAPEVLRRKGFSQRAALQALERTARVKALAAFKSFGGTCAQFDRVWPTIFNVSWSETDVMMGASEQPASESPVKPISRG